MAAKHTPGPWAVEEVAGCIEVVNEETLFTIARIGLGGGEAARPLVIANARLIAAAPDLLAALQQAKNSLVAFKFMPAGNAWEDSDEANLQAVDAAIAKATGGAP